ncbi:Sperm acrosome-associated protein 5 [Fukomys damarensis]|uniref:Sperm acrosome-associated protein 5 n=1 Tax=Fukomys damarensis TaxID=885580 RepID=A0A091CXT2_FUKDA|nr:Sperm acrosome-associated protein 5 [Fukomys damarensis]
MQFLGTVIVISSILMAPNVDAKIFERCELAKKLEEAGLNSYKGYSIGDWLCMAHYESGFDTSFVDHNPDGSSEYGIFQLNSAWCAPGHHVSLSAHPPDLLNRHILDDVMCAKLIVSSKNSMNAWDSWSRHCSGHDLSKWLKGCDVNIKTDSPKINS